MSAWGHAAGVLPVDQATYTDHTGAQVLYLCAAGRGCDWPATHWTGYRYAVARPARILQETRKVCEHHAGQFASRYGIVVTTEPPAPTVTQTIIGQFLGDS